MDVFFGYAVISLMGVCLGMIGAGGSILALPVLVYIFRIDPTLATSYTSILVGMTAATGAIRNMIARSIDVHAVFSFGIPCVEGAYLARLCLTTFIPKVILCTSMFSLSRDGFIMLLFSVTMLLAGLSMLSRRNHQPLPNPDYRWLLPVGLLVGVVTGIVGAGGGFLILPALVILAGLDMRSAVGTSLTIIAIKSLTSAVGDASMGLQINITLIGSLMLVAIPSVLVGRWLNAHVKAQGLKMSFGVVITVIGGIIGIQQIVALFKS